MGKMKLDLGDLHVDSFQVQPKLLEQWGTVEGREFTFGCFTFFGYTCETCRGQFTCGASCEGTCGITCDLSCDKLCPETGPVVA